MSNDVVTAKQAVEIMLERRLAEDPGFLGELTLDPDGAVRPLISQVLGDDGDVDLSDVGISVHVETGKRLHFVVQVGVDDEVQGFSSRGSVAGSLRGSPFNVGLIPGPRVQAGIETASGVCICDTEDCETQVVCDLTSKC